MTLLTILLTLAIFGFIVWLILQIPMPDTFRNIILGIVIIFAVLWALQFFGINTGFPRMRLF